MELYNLKDDISEKVNLAETRPEKLNEMMLLLENWKRNLCPGTG